MMDRVINTMDLAVYFSGSLAAFMSSFARADIKVDGQVVKRCYCGLCI